MKKFLCYLLLFTLLPIMGMCESMDYASMTTDELHAIINGARNELCKREFVASENEPLFSKDGVSLYFTGKRESYGSTGLILSLGAVIVNDGDKKVAVRADDAVVDGWTYSAMTPGEVPAGAKKAGAYQFTTKGEIEDMTKVQEFTAFFYLYYPDTKERVDIGTLTVHFPE